MTPFFIAAVIVGAPFVFWLLRRRARPRPGRECPDGLPATSVLHAEALITATLKIAHPPDSVVSVEAEETPVDAAKEKPAQEAPAGFHVATTSTQSELDTSTQQHCESHSSEEENDAKIIASDQISSTEQVPSAHTETFQEFKMPATDIGTPGIGDPEQPEKPIILLATIAVTSGDGPEAEHTAKETEVAALTVIQCPKDELTQANSDVEQTQAPLHGAKDSADEDAKKTAQRYRPPTQRLPRQEAPAKPVNQRTKSVGSPTEELEIRVRLKFDRFGICEIGLLPERRPELDSEVLVRSEGISLHLVGQEDWYVDLQFGNVGDHLRRGVELKGRLADHRRARWLLTGRELYVLASHQRASGFVSTNRLVLGRSHVVLCTTEILQQVEAILALADCQGYTKLDEAHGMPSGWVGLSGVAPTNAVPLIPGSDPFYPIKPAPDIEIEFEGGVCLRNSVWLAGFPPRIKLFGEIKGSVKVLIDGKEASHTEDGSYAVDGYDQTGLQHSVHCDGFSCSRSYSIEDPPKSWQEWPAYQFGQANICGPLVHLTPEASSRRVFSVPTSNPLLLGAEPGQIYRCSPRSVANWKGLVPFDVVWALPAQPLISNKKTVRIIQFANTPLALANTHMKAALHWSAAILDASRKGLQIEKNSPDATLLWSEYKKAARNIRRAAR